MFELWSGLNIAFIIIMCMYYIAVYIVVAFKLRKFKYAKGLDSKFSCKNYRGSIFNQKIYSKNNYDDDYLIGEKRF